MNFTLLYICVCVCVCVWRYTQPNQTRRWFRFQPADRSPGQIYLQMTQFVICPHCTFLDPDNRSITNRSRRWVSKQMRPHNQEGKKIVDANKNSPFSEVMGFESETIQRINWLIKYQSVDSLYKFRFFYFCKAISMAAIVEKSSNRLLLLTRYFELSLSLTNCHVFLILFVFSTPTVVW